MLSRIDTDLLYAPFLAKLQALLDDAMGQGHAFWVVEGYRSYTRSEELYAQGRSKQGPVVTRARAGQSAHNFGIAADLVLDGYLERAGLQPDYRPDSYEPLRALAPKHGLVWGGGWAGLKDYPHVQLPNWVTAVDLYPLREAFSTGGLTAAWAVLDRQALS